MQFCSGLSKSRGYFFAALDAIKLSHISQLINIRWISLNMDIKIKEAIFLFPLHTYFCTKTNWAHLIVSYNYVNIQVDYDSQMCCFFVQGKECILDSKTLLVYVYTFAVVVSLIYITKKAKLIFDIIKGGFI